MVKKQNREYVVKSENCNCLLADDEDAQKIVGKDVTAELIRAAIPNLKVSCTFEPRVNLLVWKMFINLQVEKVSFYCPKCGRRYTFNISEPLFYSSVQKSQP